MGLVVLKVGILVFEYWLCHLQAVKRDKFKKWPLFWSLVCKMELTTHLTAIGTNNKCKMLDARCCTMWVFLLPLEYLDIWATSGWPFSSFSPLLIWDLVGVEREGLNCGLSGLAWVKMMGRYWDIGQVSWDKERRYVHRWYSHVLCHWECFSMMTFLRTLTFPPKGS